MVSNIFYFHPYLGKISILTNIFQMGWNHQPVQQKTKLQNPIIHHFATDPLARNRGLCWELYFIFFQPWPPSLGCDLLGFLVIFKISKVHVHVEKPWETPEKTRKTHFWGNYPLWNLADWNFCWTYFFLGSLTTGGYGWLTVVYPSNSPEWEAPGPV